MRCNTQARPIAGRAGAKQVKCCFVDEKPLRSPVVPLSTAKRNQAGAMSHPAAPLAIDDTRIREITELAPPAHLLREFPVSARAAATTFGRPSAVSCHLGSMVLAHTRNGKNPHWSMYSP